MDFKSPFKKQILINRKEEKKCPWPKGKKIPAKAELLYPEWPEAGILKKNVWQEWTRPLEEIMSNKWCWIKAPYTWGMSEHNYPFCSPETHRCVPRF